MQKINADKIAYFKTLRKKIEKRSQKVANRKFENLENLESLLISEFSVLPSSKN